MRNMFSRLLVFVLLVALTATGSIVSAQSATKDSPAKEGSGSKAASESKAVAQPMQKQTQALPERVAPDQAKWYEQYKLQKKQKNLMKPEDQLLNEAPEPEIGDGFVELFNGKDLTGWTAKGGKCTFEVIDGKHCRDLCAESERAPIYAPTGMTTKISFSLAK